MATSAITSAAATAATKTFSEADFSIDGVAGAVRATSDAFAFNLTTRSASMQISVSHGILRACAVMTHNVLRLAADATDTKASVIATIIRLDVVGIEMEFLGIKTVTVVSIEGNHHGFAIDPRMRTLELPRLQLEACHASDASPVAASAVAFPPRTQGGLKLKPLSVNDVGIAYKAVDAILLFFPQLLHSPC